jgi:hypothetical protein
VTGPTWTASSPLVAQAASRAACRSAPLSISPGWQPVPWWTQKVSAMAGAAAASARVAAAAMERQRFAFMAASLLWRGGARHGAGRRMRARRSGVLPGGRPTPHVGRPPPAIRRARRRRGRLGVPARAWRVTSEGRANSATRQDGRAFAAGAWRLASEGWAKGATLCANGAFSAGAWRVASAGWAKGATQRGDRAVERACGASRPPAGRGSPRVPAGRRRPGPPGRQGSRASGAGAATPPPFDEPTPVTASSAARAGRHGARPDARRADHGRRSPGRSGPAPAGRSAGVALSPASETATGRRAAR